MSVQTVEGGVSEEEAILKVEQLIEFNWRKVLEMLYKRKGSIVPRECKELFWKTCMMTQRLYGHDRGDEFSSPRNIAEDMNAVVSEPLHLTTHL